MRKIAKWIENKLIFSVVPGTILLVLNVACSIHNIQHPTNDWVLIVNAIGTVISIRTIYSWYSFNQFRKKLRELEAKLHATNSEVDYNKLMDFIEYHRIRFDEAIPGMLWLARLVRRLRGRAGKDHL